MLKRLILLSLLLGLCGCASVLQKKLYADYSAAPLDSSAMTVYTDLMAALQKPLPAGAFAIPAACFEPVISSENAVTCAGLRNQAVAALLIGSDSLCVDHRRTIYGNDASWNVTSGTLTNLFAGAASVVHAETAKSILAALALFANSERSLVNETVYKQMLVTAVDKKIVEGRETKADAIYLFLKQPISAYSLHDALRDVFAFHNSCSFMSGLQKVLEEGTQGSAAQRILRLRSTLASIGAEIATIAKDDPTGKLKDKYEQLASRHKAVSDTLRTLETH